MFMLETFLYPVTVVCLRGRGSKSVLENLGVARLPRGDLGLVLPLLHVREGRGHVVRHLQPITGEHGVT